jgi:hypothetical protein
LCPCRLLTFITGKSFSQVAKCSATSKEGWELQCKLWPTSYHPAQEYVYVALFIFFKCIILKYKKIWSTILLKKNLVYSKVLFLHSNVQDLLGQNIKLNMWPAKGTFGFLRSSLQDLLGQWQTTC